MMSILSDLPQTVAALEKLLNNYAGKYATGDEVSLVCFFFSIHIYACLKFTQ